MTDQTAIDFPDTPAGRAAKWFLHHASTRGAELTLEEITEHMHFEPPWVPENSMERFEEGGPQDRKIVEVNSISPVEVEFFEVDSSNRRWRAEFRVEHEPPHRITFLEFRADLGPGVVLRLATPDDTAALAEVERAAPIVAGERTQTYDRGDDFLAFTRLMEENAFYVVESDGELLGVYGAASHIVRCAGREHRAMVFHHLRIPAAQEKRGFFSALNMRLFDHYADIYGPWWKKDAWAPYGHIQVANTSAMRLGAPGSWSFGPLRLLLDCRALAGHEYGRTTTPQDAATTVDIINRCHDVEAMFLPYTVESLTARLERAPDLYTWDNLLLGESAVVGVWPSGLRVITEDGDERREAVRASVLDFGFLPGAEDELEKLIRSWCSKLVELGTTELSFITSESSPGHALLMSLAFQTDAFDYKMSIPEPEGAATKGLYIDPVYF